MKPTSPFILRGELPSGLTTLAADSLSSRDLLSKADFVHAVQTLAVSSSKAGPGESAPDGLGHVLVACAQDTWKQAFGEPRKIQEYRGAVSDPPVEVWEQPCSDGVVHCVGYFVDDPHDGQRVVLARVCLF